jgi:hypothetical protein
MSAALAGWAAWCLALLLAAGCQPDRAMPGRYVAPHPDDPDSQVVLVLQATGKGSWTYSDEEVSFRWESKADEVWLHLKGGGLITGQADRYAEIKLGLPGHGMIIFQRSGPRE